MQDAGALPIEVDVTSLNMGDVIDIYPYKGEIRSHATNALLATFALKLKFYLMKFEQAGGLR